MLTLQISLVFLFLTQFCHTFAIHGSLDPPTYVTAVRQKTSKNCPVLSLLLPTFVLHQSLFRGRLVSAGDHLQLTQIPRWETSGWKSVSQKTCRNFWSWLAIYAIFFCWYFKLRKPGGKKGHWDGCCQHMHIVDILYDTVAFIGCAEVLQTMSSEDRASYLWQL